MDSTTPLSNIDQDKNSWAASTSHQVAAALRRQLRNTRSNRSDEPAPKRILVTSHVLHLLSESLHILATGPLLAKGRGARCPRPGEERLPHYIASGCKLESCELWNSGHLPDASKPRLSSSWSCMYPACTPEARQLLVKRQCQRMRLLGA